MFYFLWPRMAQTISLVLLHVQYNVWLSILMVLYVIIPGQPDHFDLILICWKLTCHFLCVCVCVNPQLPPVLRLSNSLSIQSNWISPYLTHSVWVNSLRHNSLQLVYSYVHTLWAYLLSCSHAVILLPKLKSVMEYWGPLCLEDVKFKNPFVVQ